MSHKGQWNKPTWIAVRGRKIYTSKIPVSARDQIATGSMKRWMYVPVIRVDDNPQEVLDRLEMIFGGGLSLVPYQRKGYYVVMGLGNVVEWCEDSVKLWKETLEGVAV